MNSFSSKIIDWLNFLLYMLYTRHQIDQLKIEDKMLKFDGSFNLGALILQNERNEQVLRTEIQHS